MEKKILLATCYDKVNYGSVLQAYATQVAVEQLGYSAIAIDKSGLAKDIGKGRRKYYAHHLFDLELYRTKLGYVFHRIRQKIDSDFARKMRARKNEFTRFVEETIELTPHLESFAELTQYCKGYTDVVVGSDQLWLPVNISGDYFTLSFAPQGARKTAYATSFGVSRLSSGYMEKTKDFLKDFHAISVREESGARIIESLGLKAAVTCDPTMLLDRETWLAVADSSYETPSQPYILCYLLGKNIWHREAIKKISQRTGMPILAISHCDEYIAYDDDGFADFQPYDVGPAQWLRLFSEASFICTDSFHGTVFSTLFEKQFISFRRHQGQGSQSTNSRLDTLLSRLELTERICEDPQRIEELTDTIVDFEKTGCLVADYRDESRAWLAEALK